MNRYLLSALTIVPVLPVLTALVPGGTAWYRNQIDPTERDFGDEVPALIRAWGSFFSGLTQALTFRPESARKQWFADIDAMTQRLGGEYTTGQRVGRAVAKFLAGSLAWLATAFSATCVILFTLGAAGVAVSAASWWQAGLKAVTNFLGNVGGFFETVGKAFNVFTKAAVWVPTLIGSVVTGIVALVGYDVYKADFKDRRPPSESPSFERRPSVSSHDADYNHSDDLSDDDKLSQDSGDSRDYNPGRDVGRRSQKHEGTRAEPRSRRNDSSSSTERPVTQRNFSSARHQPPGGGYSGSDYGNQNEDPNSNPSPKTRFNSKKNKYD